MGTEGSIGKSIGGTGRWPATDVKVGIWKVVGGEATGVGGGAFGVVEVGVGDDGEIVDIGIFRLLV